MQIEIADATKKCGEAYKAVTLSMIECDKAYKESNKAYEESCRILKYMPFVVYPAAVAVSLLTLGFLLDNISKYHFLSACFITAAIIPISIMAATTIVLLITTLRRR